MRRPTLTRDDLFPLSAAKFCNTAKAVGANSNGEYVMGPFMCADMAEYVRVSGHGIFGGATVTSYFSLGTNKDGWVAIPNGAFTENDYVEFSASRGSYIRFVVSNAGSTTNVEIKVQTSTS
jgi:hypothetical protein